MQKSSSKPLAPNRPQMVLLYNPFALSSALASSSAASCSSSSSSSSSSSRVAGAGAVQFHYPTPAFGAE